MSRCSASNPATRIESLYIIKQTETNKKPNEQDYKRIRTWNVRILLGSWSIRGYMAREDSNLFPRVEQTVRKDSTLFSDRLLVIFVSKQAQGALMEWKAHIDRIISARFFTRLRKLTVI